MSHHIFLHPGVHSFNPPKQKGIQCRFGERGVTAATHYDGGRNMIAMITGAKRYVLSPPNACPLLGIVTSRGHPSYRHSMLNFGRVTLLEDEDASLKISEREREWLRIAAEAPSLSTVREYRIAPPAHANQGHFLLLLLLTPRLFCSEIRGSSLHPVPLVCKSGIRRLCVGITFCRVFQSLTNAFLLSQHYIISLQKSAQCNTRSGVSVTLRSNRHCCFWNVSYLFFFSLQIHEEGNEYWGGLAEVEECVGDD